jgi:integrase
LLYVPTHPAREFDKDLEAAGIPKVTSAGKLDFHTCRLAYINLVLESGATVKEAQELARHSTPQLTMNIYGRVREERLAQAVDKVADALRQDNDPTP